MTKPLGKLESVSLREIWETEDRDFTPWLAQEENLGILGDAIGIELELEAQEKDVGSFRADILCKEISDGSGVLIENQIEKTDHRHLGQLLTYASGLKAKTIIWIAEKFTEEHRAALDWLNASTDDNFRFFGLEVELWKIDNSLAAPKFNIISKPNNWSKAISSQMKNQPETKMAIMKQHYWTALSAFLEQKNSRIKILTPHQYSYHQFSIGNSNFILTAAMKTQRKEISISLEIRGKDAQSFFHLLRNQQDEIESEIGEKLSWREVASGGRGSVISINQNNIDPTDEPDWPSQHLWFKEKLELFDEVFRNRIKELDPADWMPDEEDD